MNPVNDAPILDFIEDATINEDEIFTYELSAFDVDGDDLIFGATDGPNAMLSVSNNILVVEPNDDWFGDLTISVSVVDSEYSDSQDFIVSVLPVNDAPILDFIEDASINEDEVYTYELGAFDVDGDDLTFNATDGDNALLSISENLLTVDPNDDWYGDLIILVSVNDGEYSDSQEFILTVNPINDAPVLTQIDNQEIDEDSFISIPLDAFDIDGDNLYFGAEVNGNADFSLQDNLLIVSPNQDWYGEIIITVSVTDTQLTDTTSFTLLVNAVNDEPVLSFTPNWMSCRISRNGTKSSMIPITRIIFKSSSTTLIKFPISYKTTFTL